MHRGKLGIDFQVMSSLVSEKRKVHSSGAVELDCDKGPWEGNA